MKNSEFLPIHEIIVFWGKFEFLPDLKIFKIKIILQDASKTPKPLFLSYQSHSHIPSPIDYINPKNWLNIKMTDAEDDYGVCRGSRSCEYLESIFESYKKEISKWRTTMMIVWNNKIQTWPMTSFSICWVKLENLCNFFKSIKLNK